MQVDTFSLTVMIAAIAGFVMIAGGIALLWKGAITLAATPGTTAIAIEYRNMLKVNTQVPGIAFFVIGTSLLLAAPFLASRNVMGKFELTGKTEDVVESPIIVSASKVWNLSTFSDGEIRGTLYPDTSTLTLDVVAAGYQPYSVPIDLTASRTINLKPVKLIKAIDRIEADPTKIAKVDYPTPDLKVLGGYGGAQ